MSLLFLGHLITLISSTVQSLIAPELRPVIKHAAHLSRRGCSDASNAFAIFAYNELSNASVLPSNLAFEDFSPCNFLPELQQVLYSTNELDESVTYETLVVVPDSIKDALHEQFGDDVDINGPFVSYMFAASDVRFLCQ